MHATSNTFHVLLGTDTSNASLKTEFFPIKDCLRFLHYPKNHVPSYLVWYVHVSGISCIRYSLDINLSPQHLPRNFLYSPTIPTLIVALVPINLHLDSDIVGPTSLNAINFITLGIPSASEYGDVSVESFI